MVRQIVIEYFYNGTLGGLSVLHGDTAATNTNMTSIANGFLAFGASIWNPQTEGRWDGVIRDLNTQTGQLEDLTQVSSRSEFGTVVGDAIVSQNAAYQLTWRTNGVVNGHLVVGRSFVPFVDRSFNSNDGEPGGVPNFGTIPGALRVWARPFTHPDDPTKDRLGSEHVVSAVDGKDTEWATMGSRRRA